MKIKSILSCNNIAILWFWVEWKANFDFLKKINFEWEITILENDSQFINLDKYDLLIKSPWISKYVNKELEILISKWKVISWTEIFLNNAKWTFIWVTWTKWKSTTATLIYKLLKEKFWANTELIWNIWNPAISYVFWAEEKVYILELSSYQLEDLKWKLLDIWVLVNIFPDHLDYHWWFENYKKAKENIINISKEIIYFKDLEFDNVRKNILSDFNFSKVKLKWEHNLNNITLALIVALKFDIDIITCEKVIELFNGLPYRLEEFEFKNRLWINDSISTTPESTLAWVKVYENNLWWIVLWWKDRGYDFTNLIKYLSKIKTLNAIVLLPENDDKIHNLINDIFTIKPKILKSKNMSEIVNFLYDNTSNNSIILFSTASPSYNLYKNYMYQWDDFINNVKML